MNEQRNSPVSRHDPDRLGGEAWRAKALEIAQAMVLYRPGGSAALRRVPGLPQDGGGHPPDVIPVERFMEAKDVGGELKVGPIRDLRSDAFIRPNEARSKVYLIENAQNMNPNAQNALLKVLEEGPPYAAFLLMTDRAGALLETIRSRCAAIHVGEDDNGDDGRAGAGLCPAAGQRGRISACGFPRSL